MISDHSDSLLSEWTQAVIQTRVDLIHYPLIYYFHADAERASLRLLFSRSKEWRKRPEKWRDQHYPASRLDARRGIRGSCKGVSASVVRASEDDPHAVFDAFAKDHLANKEAAEN